ncbi:hypothetical protein, unlikely [Trypanosoma brucei brucei TREU927]|uniref:Uncharacterized protein n=1 Tax=Trypanosoma brucei brucei (strain 927/4 GUTat10.1) TaxID=185431 RepID=Q38FV0_TRYB2|nr:hypothetical protein, unlikely [Trypanosoma brucei brucei TREU927]EAN76320.1 hypothetical protein, unlikely [Trypanosoma brucei brucei TREU927]
MDVYILPHRHSPFRSHHPFFLTNFCVNYVLLSTLRVRSRNNRKKKPPQHLLFQHLCLVTIRATLPTEVTERDFVLPTRFLALHEHTATEKSALAQYYLFLSLGKPVHLTR